eukprot:1068310-Rhodomonas_salina.4
MQEFGFRVQASQDSGDPSDQRDGWDGGRAGGKEQMRARVIRAAVHQRGLIKVRLGLQADRDAVEEEDQEGDQGGHPEGRVVDLHARSHVRTEHRVVARAEANSERGRTCLRYVMNHRMIWNLFTTTRVTNTHITTHNHTRT